MEDGGFRREATTLVRLVLDECGSLLRVFMVKGLGHYAGLGLGAV